MDIVHAVDHIIRDRDGTISEHDVYPRGRDPHTMANVPVQQAAVGVGAVC